MSNRNLGKGLAIALGVLGAGNMLTPAISAMESKLTASEKNEYLETVMQSAVKLGIFSALNDKMMDNAEYKKTLKELCSEQLPTHDILQALFDSQGGTKFVYHNPIIQDLIFRMDDAEVKNRIAEIASGLYR